MVTYWLPLYDQKSVKACLETDLSSYPLSQFFRGSVQGIIENTLVRWRQKPNPSWKRKDNGPMFLPHWFTYKCISMFMANSKQ